MESELQYVVRCVVGEVVRDLWDTPLEEIVEGKLAQLLFDSDPATLEHLREKIERQSKNWSTKHGMVAIRGESMFWVVTPTRSDSPDDGPIVTLSWGWENNASVKLTGEDAVDMAIDVLKLFEDENGELQRPERPEHPMLETPEWISQHYKEFSEVASELMKHGLENGCSALDVQAWLTSGKPDVPLKHHWESFPKDHVEICSVCGHYYRTDRDDWGSQVCSGQPLKDDRSIHSHDPRRSEELREAQRLDRLVHVMGKCEATETELSPLQTQLQQIVERLTEADRERYAKERVGISER